MQDWSYLNQPPSRDELHRLKLLWQPCWMEGYENELETVDELQHLGAFGIKPPYQFATHGEDPPARKYTKLDPNVLVIATNPRTGQREGHHFLSQQHTNVVSGTTACIDDLRDVVDTDRWRITAPFP